MVGFASWEIIESAGAVEGPVNAIQAQFFDDLQTLDRFAESYDLRPSFGRTPRLCCSRPASTSVGLLWRISASQTDFSWI